MSVVATSVHIAAAPSEVWDLVMDPHRLGDWVTIHHKLLRADPGAAHEGFKMDQQLNLRGIKLDVRWQLVECEQCRLAVWEGRWPISDRLARSHARTEYQLRSEGGGTRFDYRNEFHPPLGRLGAIASRALVGGMPQREATLTLERLRTLLEHPGAAN